MHPFTVEKVSRNVHRIEVELPTARKDWEAWFLVQSDVHWDSKKCDRDKLIEHREQAIERNAGIIDLGDFWDVMQGKLDRRSSKAALRAEHDHLDYFDAVVRDAAEFEERYAPWFCVRGLGNHETAVLKFSHTNLVERLVERLNTTTGAPVGKRILAGGYAGYIRWRFKGINGDGFTQSVVGHYFHGSGGGAPITKGTIDAYRLSQRHPDADLIMMGHKHNEWSLRHSRWRINRFDKTYTDTQEVFMTPGYKRGVGDGHVGFEVERCGNEPRPIGARWIRFYWDGSQKVIRYQTIVAD